MTSWMREGQSEGVNAEDYLLGKAVGKEFEQAGTLGQINAVEYGKPANAENRAHFPAEKGASHVDWLL